MTNAWGSPQFAGKDLGGVIFTPQEAPKVLQLLAMHTLWHRVFLTKARKRDDKTLSSQTSHGNDTPTRQTIPSPVNTQYFQGFGLLFLTKVLCTAPISARPVLQQHRSAPNTHTTQPHSGGHSQTSPLPPRDFLMSWFAGTYSIFLYKTSSTAFSDSGFKEEMTKRIHPFPWQFVPVANYPFN